MGILEFLKEERFLMEEALRDYVKEAKRDAYIQIGRANITVLHGLRGTGKTTLIAQKYFEKKGKLAIHGEHLKLAGYTIKDLIPVMKHMLRDGYLFIDEITKLSNWAEEIKVLSDIYPKIKIVLTGSSAVDLQNARRTLSRRAVFIDLPPLSFREFIRIKYGKQLIAFNPFSSDPITDALRVEMDFREKINEDPEKILSEYRKQNLPYLMEKPLPTVLDMIDRVIYEDIGGVGSFSDEVIVKFWPLLRLLALSEKTSYDNLSKDLGVGKGTVIRMIEYLSLARVIKPVFPYAMGKGKIRKEPKYLFASPVIREAILDVLGERERSRGLTREDMFAMHLHELFYLKTGPDYVWRNCIFEIGGSSKGLEQFKNLEIKGRRFIIHEGVEIAAGDILRIPFYIFLTSL
jgi:predicted AAA+ superfamily ATPase